MTKTEDMTPRDAARRLGIRLDTVYALVWTGRLAAHKSDCRWRIAASAVEGCLDNARGGRVGVPNGTILDDLQLLTIPEASALLRFKESTLRSWVFQRKINYLKISNRVFIRRSDIEALIVASVVPAVKEPYE